MKKIPLSSPDITDLERKAVLEVLYTPHLSLGPKVLEFEEKFALFIGTKHAIAVNSGTSGLHLCIKALGIKEGDEVITSPFSFIASANCLLYERAVPVFVDIDPRTFNIDVNKIEKKITKKTKAILPIHIFGQPCEMGVITELAEENGLFVIEDACEAIGARYNGVRVGRFGECGVFAFYPNKQMTTGEGGIIVTNNDRVASLCRSMRNQGRGNTQHWLTHERLGYNYRLSDIQCALGIAQLGRINELLSKRKRAAHIYDSLLGNIQGMRLRFVPSHVEMSWFVYILVLDEIFSSRQRDSIINGLKKRGIGCSNYFPPIHLQPFYMTKFGYTEGDFPVTESISGRTIALPFHCNITEKEIVYVADSIKKELKKINEQL